MNVTIENKVVKRTGLVLVADVTGSNLYDVICRWNGIDRMMTTWVYTESVLVSLNGSIEIALKSKMPELCQVIPYPYHFLRNGALCAFKRVYHRVSDSYALNLDLFELEWNTSVILHVGGDEPVVFVSSRAEWFDKGNPGQENREPQVFMKADHHRRWLLNTVNPVFSTIIALWIERCIDEDDRKKAGGR